MSVKIRLTRVGATHNPFHRVVVMDSRKKRDGAFLANIGTYDAVASKVVAFDFALYDEWAAKGATPTDAAKKIYKQAKKTLGNAAPVAQEEVVAKKPAKKTAAKTKDAQTQEA